MLLLQSFTLPTTRRCLSWGEGGGGGGTPYNGLYEEAPPPVFFLDKTEALGDGKSLFETLRPLI